MSVQREKLREQLLSNSFRLRIDRLSKYTIRTAFEGGIAGYADGTMKMELPDPQKLQDQSTSFDITGDMVRGYATFNSAKLLKTGLTLDREGNIIAASRIRNDISFFIHSHPLHEHDTSQAAKDLLCPSEGDLESWEEVDGASPGVTTGVLVPTPTSRQLLLWRHAPEEQLIPYYQQLEGDEAAARVIRVMRDSRIRVATMDMTMQGQAYTEQVDATIDRLF